MLRPLLRNLLALASHTVRRSQKFSHQAANAPIVERLEERCLLAMFTVTTTADAGPGSLRQAILDANAHSGLDMIAFAIADGGVQTIRPRSNLPNITDPVLLDGTTQPGFAGQPLIVLNGRNTSSPSGTTNGLTIAAGGSTVRGFVIQAFSNGIVVTGSGNTIAGNYIGTDTTGTQALGNGNGVNLRGTNDLVGGSAPADRNLISGNRTGISFVNSGNGPGPSPAEKFLNGNRIQGNYIGTDVSGMVALGNQGAGIELAKGLYGPADGNLVGGTDPGTGNVISGNGQDGVFILDAGDNIVQGNWVGTDAIGTHILANGSYGINISLANAPPTVGSNNLIGGTTSAARNLISGNRLGGVHVGAPNPVLGNWIGTDQSGTVALGNTTGIVVEASDVTIGGTDPGAGNLISGNLNAGISLTGSRNQVVGNTIGLDRTGLHALANGFGVYLLGGMNNQVGGLPAGAANRISGNLTGIVVFSSRDTTIQGNEIGTTADGGQAVGNFIGIDVRGADTLIGGTSAAAGNLISGNLQAGVSISGSGTQVQGNTLGTDSTGTRALPNGDGVYVTAGTDRVTIGGSEAGMGNLISGNRDAGVVLSGDASIVAGNWIGIDRSGRRVMRNRVGVHIDGTGNTLGGTANGAGNVISGNLARGVEIFGNATVLEGNYIGTDSSGTVALGNGAQGAQVGTAGVLIVGADDNRIGGVMPGAGNLISGNAVGGEQSPGISIEQSRGNLIQGNEIGTDVSGTRALGNYDGIRIYDAPENTIGGLAAGAGNLISGNGIGVRILSDSFGTSRANRIQGNDIGTDISGTVAVPNAGGINIIGGTDNLIGGTEAGARNVISGNSGGGIGISGSGNVIQGNYIGTDRTGSYALPTQIGVSLYGNNLLGGTATGAGNVIAGSSFAGIYVDSTTAAVIQGNEIGTDSTGTHALGNAVGVYLVNSPGGLIGGTQAEARNVISGNTSFGIRMNGASKVRVQGNVIGTDGTGTIALGNGTGISLDSSSGNTIGGAESGAGNLISGNASDGIRIGLFVSGNVIQGNLIGTDLSGTLPLGNGGNGVMIEADNSFPLAADNRIGGTAPGAGNRIAFNGQDGVLVDHGLRNAIRQNAIFSNGGLGIELTNGGNRMQPAPILTAATSSGGITLIQGTLASTTNTTYTIELFANTECDPSGFGEGERFLASITVATDASGNASFTLILGLPVDPGQFITATATDPVGNTSQFSNCVEVGMADPPAPFSGRGRLATFPSDGTCSDSPSPIGARNWVRHEEGLLSVNSGWPVRSGLDSLFAAMGREGWRPHWIKDGGFTEADDTWGTYPGGRG